MTSNKIFGKIVPGYNIPVLNEREIRAAAGLLFLGAFISLMLILFKGNFVPIKYFISFFVADLLTRLLIDPSLAPSLIIGRIIVRNQTPEWVGAAQKQFAWVIGLVLSMTMFVFFIIINAYGPFTGITCLICLIFLFFEASFGICLGCKVYPLFFRQKPQYCPGEVCERNARQTITRLQWLVLFLFAAGMFVMFIYLQPYYRIHPHDFLK